MGRYLGVDPGSVRVGLALSDDDARVALPFATVRRAKQDIEAARQIKAELEREGVAPHDLEALVVGLPLRLDGSEGEAARRVRLFAVQLERVFDRPLHFTDERLSTVVAEQSLRTMQVSAAAKKQLVDQAAAALLLQAFLDARGQTTWPEPHSDEATPGEGPPDPLHADATRAPRNRPGPAGRRAAGRPRKRRR